jgi:hypothetical protein
MELAETCGSTFDVAATQCDIAETTRYMTPEKAPKVTYDPNHTATEIN